MKITVISASTRDKSQSKKVAGYLERNLKKLEEDTHLLDLNELKLPVYDDSGKGPWKSDWEAASKELESSDGFVVVSPEWDGMASVGWFNMIHYLDRELANKPVMLVGVSSGMGEAYPIGQMKQMGQKNKHFVLVPENLRVAKAEETLNDDTLDKKAPDYPVKLRAEYALKMLLEYAKALTLVRDSGIVDFKNFGNGV